MPFNRPSLTELIDRAAADIEAALPGTDARLRRSNLGVMARVHAGAVHGLYGYLQWLADQLMVDTCEAAYLDRFAVLWGTARRPAAFAEGPVTFTGTSGVVVPAATQLLRADGQRYELVADATLVGGTVTAAVAAVEAGAAGNANVATQLALVQPVAGVTSVAAVAAGGLVLGVDPEADESLRLRVLGRIQQPPMGGSASDYVAWALQVPGVTRAWCYPLEGGVGTVVLRFVRDDDTGSLIPDAGEVAAVQSYIDELRPVCAALTVAAPVAVALDVHITLTPDTTAVRAAVEAELLDLLRREAKPGGTVLISHLREAVSVAAGETNHVMASPAADVTHAAGQLAILGTINWE